MPQRIQRRREKGWRMPEGAVYVGRPSRWGNPFVIAKTFERDWVVSDSGGSRLPSRFMPTVNTARALAVDLYRLHTGPMGNYEFDTNDLLHLRSELGGKDLVCWCPLPAPGEPDVCHAAVLLELANPS